MSGGRPRGAPPTMPANLMKSDAALKIIIAGAVFVVV